MDRDIFGMKAISYLFRRTIPYRYPIENINKLAIYNITQKRSVPLLTQWYVIGNTSESLKCTITIAHSHFALIEHIKLAMNQNASKVAISPFPYKKIYFPGLIYSAVVVDLRTKVNYKRRGSSHVTLLSASPYMLQSLYLQCLGAEASPYTQNPTSNVIIYLNMERRTCLNT